MDQHAIEDLDIYVKKTVRLSLAGAHLEFDVSQSLFSSHQVDLGTLHLLRTLEDHRLEDGAKVLDLGCGYGPLGLTLGRLNPGTQIHMVDRDALAVAFAQRNARAQIPPLGPPPMGGDISSLPPGGGELEGGSILAYGSLGYDDVQARDFDLIVSNIPGKAGATVIRAMLLDARAFLAPGGMVAVVVVSPLEELVSTTLATPDVEVLLHHTTSAYAIFHYRFVSSDGGAPWTSGLQRGIYDREELTFLLDDFTLPMHTAYGLPEFDTLSFESRLLIKALQDLGEARPRRVTLFNPGQGHIPVVLWRLLSPEEIHLVDRDLLSLHYARLNLIQNGCEADAIHPHHRTGLLPAGIVPDLVVGLLREEEGPEVIERDLVELGGALQPGARVLLGGGSTPVTRVLKSQEIGRFFRAVKRKRTKGNSTVLLQRQVKRIVSATICRRDGRGAPSSGVQAPSTSDAILSWAQCHPRRGSCRIHGSHVAGRRPTGSVSTTCLRRNDRATLSLHQPAIGLLDAIPVPLPIEAPEPADHRDFLADAQARHLALDTLHVVGAASHALAAPPEHRVMVDFRDTLTPGHLQQGIQMFDRAV